jgi:hypothetical protein
MSSIVLCSLGNNNANNNDTNNNNEDEETFPIPTIYRYVFRNFYIVREYIEVSETLEMLSTIRFLFIFSVAPSPRTKYID